MNIKIYNEYLIDIYSEFKTFTENNFAEEHKYFVYFEYINKIKLWSSVSKVKVTIDLSRLSIDFIDTYLEPIQDDLLQKQLRRYKKLVKNNDSIILKRLSDVVTVLKSYIQQSPRLWLFKINESLSVFEPYLVHSIEYVRADKYEKAHVSVKLYYTTLSDTKSTVFNIFLADLNKPIELILNDFMFTLGTEELIKEYDKDFKKFKSIYNGIGKQYILKGMAIDMGVSSWYRKHVYMNSIVVVDDFEELDLRHKERNAILTLIDNRIEIIPVLFYIRVFDLILHNYYSVHLNTLTEYIYNKAILDKLVLDSEIKNLINNLVTSSENILSDIIKGKSEGIIIISTGPPGTGKTLTAESYSEIIGRPLYRVQCSQLGLDVDSLESNLTKVLNRAVKWNALLLIDEADVYIRKRGIDIKQNAIVGVFLRILEYYKGVLFMTSNLGDDIDDAIMSRITAHIRYSLPNYEYKVKILEILAKEFNLELSEKDKITSFLYNNDMSGRAIKATLKLAYKLSNNININYKTWETASKYIE